MTEAFNYIIGSGSTPFVNFCDCEILAFPLLSADFLFL